MIYIILILALILLIMYIRMWLSYSPKLQSVNCFIGGLGSGKTLTLTDIVMVLYKRSLICFYLFRWNLGLLPSSTITIKNEETGEIEAQYNKYDKRTVYSNYPILLKGDENKAQKTREELRLLKNKIINESDINKKEQLEREYNKLQKYYDKHFIYSNELLREHITGELRLKEHSIIATDEAGTFFPFQNKRSNPDLIWDLTYFRHYTDSTLLVACQSIGNVDISFRRVMNTLYSLSNYTNLIFRFYKIDVQKIVYNEDANVVNTNDINKDNTLKIIKRHYKTPRYNSRYMRKFYKPKKVHDKQYRGLLVDPNSQIISKERFKELFYNGK